MEDAKTNTSYITVTLPKEQLEAIQALAEIAPALKAIVEERQEQAIVNAAAAKWGRKIILFCGAIGTCIGAMWAVTKLIFILGSK